MNKKELISRIAEDTGFTQKDVAVVIDSMVNNIETSVANGESIHLSGFGVFSLQSRAARQARNPHSNVAISVPAKVVPKFKPGKEFKEKVQK